MFQLSLQDIHPGASAQDKEQAIRLVADALAQAGCVAKGYVNGMLARELQTSTYLGNGIAIPHGTTDTRDQVLQTGVQVFQFPQGVAWSEDQIAYLVIGIAARTDEHLPLLRQLTHVLSDDSLAEQVKTVGSAQELRALLRGEKQTTELKLDNALLSLSVAASDLPTLQALNAGKLKVADAVDASFISHVMSNEPLDLGQGIWLDDSPVGNLSSAVAISRPAAPFMLQGQTVAMLVTIANADDKTMPVLTRLTELLMSQQACQLLTADNASLLALLTQPDAGAADELSAEFVICNAHGLHTRPSAILVNTIKQFSSEIRVANLDGNGKAVNGRSLMKVVALGAKQGHRLHVTARGDDAAQALSAIGEAISQGPGEGAA